jgi:molecular chaperone IbpA
MTRDFTRLSTNAIGFDRFLHILDGLQDGGANTTYPPYNIEKTGEDAYRLTVAVAGFAPEDLDVTVKENTLFVSGRVRAPEGEKVATLYRGIAGRAFERRFALADHIVVEGADLTNGLLHVGLKRVVPEALKPRRIAIGSNPEAKTIANESQPTAQAA